MSIVIPTSWEQLEYVATAIMTGIHNVFPADIVDSNNPISEKKLLKGDGMDVRQKNSPQSGPETEIFSLWRLCRIYNYDVQQLYKYKVCTSFNLTKTSPA
jgi:hypothetical protein